jgi:hypothetical protein
VAQRRGYLTITDPAARHTVEADTVGCAHCGAIIRLHHDDGTRVTSIAMCSQCGPKPVCDACDRDGRCTPLLRRIEELERRDAFLRAVEG